MRVGIPKEVKKDEGRVSLVPADVRNLVQNGVDVFVERGAGEPAGYKDDGYVGAGAVLCDDNVSLYASAELIVKVAAPQPAEYGLVASRHTVLSFFHFQGARGLLEAMCAARATCIAYETMCDDDGRLPVLSPMSKMAGAGAVELGAERLEVPVNECVLTVIGAGVAGRASADTALSMGFQKVILLDNNVERLRSLNIAGYNTAFASPPNIQRSLMLSHVVVGAVHAAGKRAPVLVTKDMLDKVEHASVFVDLCIEQGGMTEVSMPTSISEPTYAYKNTLMCCVPNVPGRVAGRASAELSAVIVGYVQALAVEGVSSACRQDAVLSRGLAIFEGVDR